MPELPEVETTRRGLEPLLVGQTIAGVNVRQPSLRWPVDVALASQIRDQRIRSVGRRGKYLLVTVDNGTLLIHLGMSGNLRFLSEAVTPSPHDHVDIILAWIAIALQRSATLWKLALHDKYLGALATQRSRP